MEATVQVEVHAEMELKVKYKRSGSRSRCESVRRSGGECASRSGDTGEVHGESGREVEIEVEAQVRIEMQANVEVHAHAVKCTSVRNQCSEVVSHLY